MESLVTTGWLRERWKKAVVDETLAQAHDRPGEADEAERLGKAFDLAAKAIKVREKCYEISATYEEGLAHDVLSPAARAHLEGRAFVVNEILAALNKKEWSG